MATYSHECKCTCICQWRATLLSLHGTWTATTANRKSTGWPYPTRRSRRDYAMTNYRVVKVVGGPRGERGGGGGGNDLGTVRSTDRHNIKNVHKVVHELIRSRRHQTSLNSARMADGKLLRKHPHHQSKWVNGSEISLVLTIQRTRRIGTSF